MRKLKPEEIKALEERRKKLPPFTCPVTTGWLSRYAKLVGPVSDGAVLD